MGAIITVENLGKKYSIGHQKQGEYQTFRDTLSHGVRSIYQRLRHPFSPNSEKVDTEDFWALKNITFHVNQGDRIGIIGRNGAGKSTLLKILSRITHPTTGTVYIKGRVASLLEVGTGFHPELTGRENIFLNGAILGMTKNDIKMRFDEIVAFAEIRKFLDTPVKRYSSGMYVRLAFSVAAHLEPEILLIDEVLSVGDIVFQRKCLGKMNNASGEGRTVIFVSHNMSAIQSLCSKAIHLKNGVCLYNGPVNQAVEHYISQGYQNESGEILFEKGDKQFDTPEIMIQRIALYDQNESIRSVYSQSEAIRVLIDYKVKRKLHGLRIYIQLMAASGEKVLVTDDFYMRDRLVEIGSYKSSCTIPPYLLNNIKYAIRIGADIPLLKPLIKGTECIQFRVETGFQERIAHQDTNPGIVAPKIDWEIV